MSERIDITNTLSADKVVETDNLLDVYKAEKEQETPRRKEKPKKKTNLFIYLTLVLLVFLIGTIVYIFNVVDSMGRDPGGTQFESVLDN